MNPTDRNTPRPKRPSARRDKVKPAPSKEARAAGKTTSPGERAAASASEAHAAKAKRERREPAARARGKASAPAPGESAVRGANGHAPNEAADPAQRLQRPRVRNETGPTAAEAQDVATPSTAPDAAQRELREVERGMEALLRDAHPGGANGDTHSARALDAISNIATRLAADNVVGDSVLPKARQYLSAGYYLKQWGERGMRNRADRVDDFGLDRTYEASMRPFFELMANKYFRIEISGVENIPNQGRALLIGNHSGTLPWDGVMLRTALRQHHPVAREMRWLVEDYVYHAPFLGAFVNRIGAVRACQENAQRLLESEELVAVFPEGIKGIAKRWSDRYKLQRFGRGGYVKLALRTGTPVIPVAVVGAEETYPLLHMVKAFSKALGMPFLPVTPTFPLLGPLGLAPLPSRWFIRIGQPVTDLQAHGADDARDDVLIGELNQRVRSQVERLVQDTLATRGKHVFV